MEYGYCFWYEDGEISSIPSQVKRLGLDYGKVSLTYPWPDMVPRSEMPITKKELERLGVRFAFHCPLEGLFLFNPRKEIANAAVSIHVKCLEFAAELDPLYYTFHIKADPMTLRIKGKDVGLQRCLNGLDRLIESAQELDIRLVVENSSSTAYLVPTQDLLSRELGLNLDIGHWFKGGRGYDELNHLMKDIGHRVVLLHLHDTKYQDTPAEDHLPLGHGDIDFPRAFNILKGSGIQWINLETISSEKDVVPENLPKARELASIMQDI